MSRSSFSLTHAAGKIKADLYIAHNLGAIRAACLSARKHRSKYAFDAEDFHRGQEKPGSREETRSVLLEDSYIPGTVYVSSASPLIAKEYRQLYNKEVFVINNVFSGKFLAASIRKPERPLKLFWFSQTIGKGRGIEDVILALKQFPVGSFTLTLVGKSNTEVKEYFTKLAKAENGNVDIRFTAPVSSENLFVLAAQHDIGLALEQPLEENRNVCLTNKIFTYLLAGNAILFSDTEAQKRFLNENPTVGLIYRSGDVDGLVAAIRSCMNTDHLLKMKHAARQLGVERYNWEVESEKLVARITRELN